MAPVLRPELYRPDTFLARSLDNPFVVWQMVNMSIVLAIRAKRIKQWTFYRRDEGRIKEIKRLIART